MKNIVQFLKESYEEVSQKMTWTSWANLQQYTIIILVFMVIFALLVWAMDLSASNGMKMIYSIF